MPTSEQAPPREGHLVDIVFPGQTNHRGSLFGGEALALMDKAAFIVASRYARRNVVTASADKTEFTVPIEVGQLVEIQSRIAETGRSSMTVELELWAEDLLSGDRRLATRGRFVMVALDAHGRPTEVPKL